MIPLVIDNEKVAGLRKYAETHPITHPELILMVKGRVPLPGERPGHSLDMDVGYRVVYTIEEQPKRDGSFIWLRHMSMSLNVPGREPSILALETVSKGLGFPPLEECMVQYNEADGQPEVIAPYKED